MLQYLFSNKKSITSNTIVPNWHNCAYPLEFYSHKPACHPIFRLDLPLLIASPHIDIDTRHPSGSDLEDRTGVEKVLFLGNCCHSNTRLPLATRCIPFPRPA